MRRRTHGHAATSRAEVRSNPHVVARTRHQCVGAHSGLCLVRSRNVRALIARDPGLARSHYDYRKPLYFAVRENRIDVVRFLLEHDRNPLDLWVDDDPIEIARDRGYTEMQQLLARTLDTTFNASPKGEPVASALREHDLGRMRALLDGEPQLVAT